MKGKKGYQITVTLDVADHNLGSAWISAIEDTLRSIQGNPPFHWFCEGEIVPFKVYQQCEFNALMAVHDDRESLGFADDDFDNDAG